MHNYGQRVRKHADQLKLRMETDNEADLDIPTEDSDQLDSGMEPDENETDSPTEQPEQPEQLEQPEPILLEHHPEFERNLIGIRI